MSDALLQIDQLTVRFGASTVVDQVSFHIAAGEKFALVGESGSGKSITALSVLRLVDAATTTGSIRFDGEELTTKSEREMRGIRGARIGMIFQEPMTALNPLYTVGNQIAEVLELHEALRPNAARARVIELLQRTGIPDPELKVDAYPHQLSGGQRQRAMIAMALACRPQLLICDEPTTALDVTIQAQILALLDELQRDFALALLFITHDLNLVRRFTHRVGVMERGRLVETGPTAEVFAQPQHPYTQRLLASRPQRVVQPVPADGETIGEIFFRGNVVMKGYLKNPSATEEAFAGGWFHTGDLAVMHPDGYVKIKDRSKDIIISGGENISSIEVEDVLHRHPAVMLAAVVALPDAKWGEVPCAFVELKPGAQAAEAEVIEFCRSQLARFKVPKRVVFGELPKTSTGKIQKFQLRERAKSASAIE